MKKLLIIIFPILLISSCKQTSGEKNGTGAQIIEISGSDTELPIVQKLAQIYGQTNTLVTIHVNGGGSSVGFGDILNEKSQIANASRSISDKEQAEAAAKKINLLPIMFAVDAVVIITNSKLGIDSLSLEQVGQILSGKIKNWKEVGGPDKEIMVYGRDSTSGTQAFLKGKFKIGSYAQNVKTFKETKDIVSAVEKDLAGIGYSGLGYILDRNGKPNGKIWSMPLYIDASHQAVSPIKVSDVIKGDYPLTRPLYQYVKDKPEINVKNFILFELSGDGYKIIKEFGYFPINDYQKEINKLNGLNL